MFKYINHCDVPEKGWDIIFNSKEGIKLDNDLSVNKIYVEMKNKHN